MNAQAIHTSVITVKYADPPKDGKKQATVKAADGTIFGVWPKDLGRFQPGRRYRVEYTQRSYQGRDYRTVVKAEPEEAPERSANPGPPVAAGAPSEFEFVTRLLAAYVQCCGVENSPAGLAAKARMLREVYREVFGA